MSNQVAVVGNLTADPELRFTGTGKAVASFTVAVSGGRGKESSFFNVIVWDAAAENVASSFRKGDRAVVVGRLEQQRWEKDGQKRSNVQIVASNVGADTSWATVEITRTERTDATPAQASSYSEPF